MPLDNLPKSFALKEMKKGYFPHLYNKQEMNNLEGSKFYHIYLLYNITMLII